MPILKRKIAQAKQSQKVEPIACEDQDNERPRQKNYSLRNRDISTSLQSKTKSGAVCKNVMKNYSRALVNFAISELAVPYLEKSLQYHQLDLHTFQSILASQKEKINCIKNLRELLIIKETDNKEMAAVKTVFKGICEVFLRLFSVNWIYHSKVGNRKAHLTYRFKILRRIKNPECFTYLESFKDSLIMSKH